MPLVRKAYAYITRRAGTATEFLVFRHRDFPEAGVQVPKGTMERDEAPLAAALREVMEETGLTRFVAVRALAVDLQAQPDGTLHERHFFHLVVDTTLDTWEHSVSGAGVDNGLTFRYFWARSAEEVGLWPGFGDYLHLVLTPAPPAGEG